MGGGNSSMMLENRITTTLEQNIQNHVNIVNETTQNVTQKYVDKVTNSTAGKSNVNQTTLMRNTHISGYGTLNIVKDANIDASLIAEFTVTNNITDRTNLAAVMTTALSQAVESQAEMDTSQKAVNSMEQMNQNNGGVEGVTAQVADTLTASMGGGNDEQDIKNIMDNSVTTNVNNNLNMTNRISTGIEKSFESDTFNECTQDLSISQLTDMKDIYVSDYGTLNDIQTAVIKSTVNCFNEVFNIREIATGIQTTSGQDAEQAITAVATLKSKQDLKNTLKQTKLQKNFLDSLMGGCGMIIIVIVVLVIGVGGKMGGKGGGGKGGGGSSAIGGVIGLFIFIFIIGIIILLVIHKDAFTGSKPDRSTLDTTVASQNTAARFILEQQTSGTDQYKIFSEAGENAQMYLTSTDSNEHSSTNIQDRPQNSRNLEFRSTDNGTIFNIENASTCQQSPTTGQTTSSSESAPNPLLYKIFTTHVSIRYQLGFLYSENTRDDPNDVIVEPILYKENDLSEDEKCKYVFSVTSLDPSKGVISIYHTNTNIDNDNDLDLDMVGALYISNVGLNGGELRQDVFQVKGAEFRFS